MTLTAARGVTFVNKGNLKLSTDRACLCVCGVCDTAKGENTESVIQSVGLWLSLRSQFSCYRPRLLIKRSDCSHIYSSDSFCPRRFDFSAKSLHFSIFVCQGKKTWRVLQLEFVYWTVCCSAIDPVVFKGGYMNMPWYWTSAQTSCYIFLLFLFLYRFGKNCSRRCAAILAAGVQPWSTNWPERMALRQIATEPANLDLKIASDKMQEQKSPRLKQKTKSALW